MKGFYFNALMGGASLKGRNAATHGIYVKAKIKETKQAWFEEALNVKYKL